MFVKNFLEALGFLTIFPVSKTRASQLAKAMIFFPLVGFLIGVFSFGGFLLMENFLPSLAYLALVLIPILVTGGLHADGFTDFCDGFFSGRPKEEVLRIMKDSRIGAFGGLGLIFLVLAKYELVQQMPLTLFIFSLALAAGRWMQVALSFYLPYAGLEGGLGAATASRVGKRELIGASFF